MPKTPKRLRDPAPFLVFFYNFCRIHKTLRVTPAMEAGVTDRLWDVEDIAALVEAGEVKADHKCGPYKRRIEYAV